MRALSQRVTPFRFTKEVTNLVWLFSWFSGVSRRRPATGKPPRRPVFPRARLGLEEMEPRDLLAATLLWVAEEAGVFSQANNFVVAAVGQGDGR
jgi:hypothetical protein